jgi:hypothetical protein
MKKNNQELTNTLRSILNQGNKVQLKAYGYSMIPTIWKGNIIEIEFKPIGNLVFGDLIAFERSEHVIVHRVIRLEASSDEKKIICQGMLFFLF